MNAIKTIAAQTYRTARSHPVFLRWPTSKEFVKFTIVGAVNVIIDFTVYILLSRGIAFFFDHLLTANIISYLAAAVNSFVWNKYWTFRNDSVRWKSQAVKFFAVIAGAFVIAQATFWIGVHLLGQWDIAVKAVAIVLGTLWNFSLNKWWTFKKITP